MTTHARHMAASHPPAPTTNQPNRQDPNDTWMSPAVVGVVIGCIIIMFLLAMCLFPCCRIALFGWLKCRDAERRKEKRKNSPSANEHYHMHPPSVDVDVEIGNDDNNRGSNNENGNGNDAYPFNDPTQCTESLPAYDGNVNAVPLIYPEPARLPPYGTG